MCIEENAQTSSGYDDHSRALQPLSDSDDYSVVESVYQPKWTGYYTMCLCAEHSPKQRNLGWAVGYGNPKFHPTGAIDLRLDMSKRKNLGLSRRHAYFDFSAGGQFCVRADNPDGRTDVRSISLNGCKFNENLQVIASLGPTQVNFGEYSYVFRFVEIVEQESWKRSCHEFLQGRHKFSSLPSFITFTPTPSDQIIVGRWSVRSTVATGSSGFVSAAVDLQMGTVVAAKRFGCKSTAHRHEAEAEISMMKDHLPNHVRLPASTLLPCSAAPRWLTVFIQGQPCPVLRYM